MTCTLMPSLQWCWRYSPTRKLRKVKAFITYNELYWNLSLLFPLSSSSFITVFIFFPSLCSYAFLFAFFLPLLLFSFLFLDFDGFLYLFPSSVSSPFSLSSFLLIFHSQFISFSNILSSYIFHILIFISSTIYSFHPFFCTFFLFYYCLCLASYLSSLFFSILAFLLFFTFCPCCFFMLFLPSFITFSLFLSIFEFFGLMMIKNIT